MFSGIIAQKELGWVLRGFSQEEAGGGPCLAGVEMPSAHVVLQTEGKGLHVSL